MAALEICTTESPSPINVLFNTVMIVVHLNRALEPDLQTRDLQVPPDRLRHRRVCHSGVTRLPRLQAVTENTHESITAPLPLIVSTFTTMLVSPSLAKASAGARAKLIFHRSLPEPKCMRPLLALV